MTDPNITQVAFVLAITAVFAAIALGVLCACMRSSQCSREEERQQARLQELPRG